jgi:galactokinase
VELVSDSRVGVASFHADDATRDPAVPWADPVKAVLSVLALRRISPRGFNAAITSDLPVGSGLGGSAALTTATLLSFRRMYPFPLEVGVAAPVPDGRGALPALNAAERLDFARLCQQAEEAVAGVNCGLLDPLTILSGRDGCALELDFLHHTVTPVPLPAGTVLVLAPTGVQHSSAGGALDELRSACEEAARVLGVTALRKADMARLDEARSRLSPRAAAVAEHVIAENARVARATRALEEGSAEEFGQLMFQSHASSRELLGNSCPELDAMVELAQSDPRCLGARLTGRGFGGATLHLVRAEAVEDYGQWLAEGFLERTGRTMEPVVCRASEGVKS